MLDEDDEDVLENEGLVMSFKQRIADKRKLVAQQHANKNLVPVDEDDWAEPGVNGRMLTKYDDVGEKAIQKKKANRMQVGQNKVTTETK